MSEQPIEVEFTDSKARRRRYRFEAHTAGSWCRIEEVYRDETWQPVGQEIVTDVTVDVE